MKRIVTFLLIVTLVLGLGVSAAAKDSPSKDQESATTTAALPKTTGQRGLGLYNSDDKRIATVPANAVRKISVGNAKRLDDDDREAFLAAYEDAKNVDGKIVKYFYWLDIPARYKTDDFAYAKYIFTCTGKNVEVTVNGKQMEVDKIDRYMYCAKLTEFGAVAILCD